MNGALYFLIASLPSLKWGERPAWDFARFVDACEPWISPSMIRWLSSAGLFQTESRPTSWTIVNRWYAREHALRAVLAKLRAERLKWKQEVNPSEVEPDDELARLARFVMTLDSPGAAEEALDRFRWEFLESLEAFHYFDEERLALYGLKLRLLERRSTFDRGQGEERIKSFMESARQSAAGSVREGKGVES